jgi:acyl-ACP thioesterase
MENHRHLETFLIEKEAFSRDIPKIKRNLHFENLFHVQTLYSNLDMNGHTNARKYIDWLDDAIYEIHGTKILTFMHMAYFHECKYNEEIIIQVGTEDKTVFQGLKPKSKQLAFHAKVEFL